MRSVKMVVGGGVLLLLGTIGAWNNWGHSQRLKNLIATGEKLDGFVIEKNPQNISGARSDYLHCILVEGNPEPEHVPFIVAAAAKSKGVAPPSSILRKIQGTELDPSSVSPEVKVISVDISASASFFNATWPGAQVQLATERNVDGELKNAVFVGDVERQNQGRGRMLNFLGYGLLGLLLISVGLMPAKGKRPPEAAPAKEESAP